MSIRLRTVVTGALSYVPGAMPLYRRFTSRPNPAPAELSYGIWLKHLALSQACRTLAVPRIVAELGPGLSLGAGLAALICGAQRYIALDAVRFAPMAQVLPTFDRLVELFMRPTRPDNANGFPSYESLLDGAGFPAQALPEAHMRMMLEPERIAKLRADVQTFVGSGGQASAHITYLAPWQLAQVLQRGEIDFLFSHTVLQHVQSPDVVWKDIGELLCPGGVCSHQISFDSHGTSAVWNGHWAYPEALWRIALGRKAFLINREPLSGHLSAAQRGGLVQVAAMRLQDHTGIRRSAIARQWRNLDDHDFTTRGTLLVARKR